MMKSKKKYPTQCPESVVEQSREATVLYISKFGTKNIQVALSMCSILTASIETIARSYAKQAIFGFDEMTLDAQTCLVGSVCEAMRLYGYTEIVHDGLPYTAYPPLDDWPDVEERVNEHIISYMLSEPLLFENWIAWLIEGLEQGFSTH